MGFIGVLDATGGVEGAGGHALIPKKRHAQGLRNITGHGGHTSPTCSCHQPFYTSN